VHDMFNNVDQNGKDGSMAWYRAVLQCDGVPPASGADGAKCITTNFAKRTWHKNAICSWDGSHLALSVENDFGDVRSIRARGNTEFVPGSKELPACSLLEGSA
jgi:hypothetical protein